MNPLLREMQNTENLVSSVEPPLNLPVSPPPPRLHSVGTNIVMICASTEGVLLTIKLSGHQTGSTGSGQIKMRDKLVEKMR